MNEQGYQIFHINKAENAAKVGQKFLKQACEMLFGFYEGSQTSYLMTDHTLRKQKLNDPRCVWKQGNMKSPIISKSTGHINMYLHPEIFELKTSKEIVEVLADLYKISSDNLCLSSHEPPIVKPFKSINSPVYWEHQSCSPQQNQNLGPQYKALLCCSSGSLIQVVPKLHKIRHLLHKFTYDEKLKFLNLDELSNFVFKYTQDSDLSDLSWETISLKPGDLFVYDTSLPFQTLANKSREPFVAIPINMLPKDRVSSEQKRNIWKQFDTFQYGDWLNNVHDNREEFNWRLESSNFPSFSLTPLQLSLLSFSSEFLSSTSTSRLKQLSDQVFVLYPPFSSL